MQLNSEENRETQSSPDSLTTERKTRASKSWDRLHSGLGAVVLALGITSVWLWSEVRDEKSDAREAIAASDQRGQRLQGEAERRGGEALRASREEAAQYQATAFAMAIQPVMTLMGQVPEVTDRSVQSATENLARNGNYSFVAVTDAAGKVISSSDITVIGREFGTDLKEGVSRVEDENQAVAPIGVEGSRMGFVIVRIRNEAKS